MSHYKGEDDEITKKITLKDGLVDETKKLNDINRIKKLSSDIDNINHRLKNKGNLYEIKRKMENFLDSMDFDYLIDIKKIETEESEYKFLKAINIISPIEDDIIDLTGIKREKIVLLN